MSYTQQRNYDNLQKAMYMPGVGRYNIPAVRPDNPKADNWIGFNYARGCDEPEIHGVHFFVDDYQFERVWQTPDRYLAMLARFQAVCTPDFSTYTDFPMAVQIHNHYRKQWLGAYWQEHGVRVIPTISWSDERSFAWCFDGCPVGGTVAISSQGTQADSQSRALFLLGFDQMIARLQPSAIIFYGYIPEECREFKVDIIPVRQFVRKWHDQR